MELRAVEEYLVKYGPQPNDPDVVITKPDLIAMTPDLSGKVVKIPSTGKLGLVYSYQFNDTGLLAQMIPKDVLMEFLKQRGTLN